VVDVVGVGGHFCKSVVEPHGGVRAMVAPALAPAAYRTDHLKTHAGTSRFRAFEASLTFSQHFNNFIWNITQQ
jgi:hypothetical protein